MALALAGAAVVLLVVLLARAATLAAAVPSSVPIAVVVPARNEATSLPVLLASLQMQQTAPAETIVVDDGSTDATAAVAAGAGATVISVDGPPPGWTGKAWACHRGVAATNCDVIVLLDADTRLAPDGIGRLVTEHRTHVADGLLSVQPHHDPVRPYEQLSAICNLVPVLASGMCALRPPRTSPIAFGPCLVTSRQALEAAGGFASVRAEVLEDAALAARYGAVGRPVRCRPGGTTVRFRMYPGGVRSLVEGWTKHLAGGATRAPIVPTLGAVAVVALLLAVAGSIVAAPSWEGVAAWGVAALALGWALRRVGTFRWWIVAAWPVPLAVFGALFVRSLWARFVRRSVTWRGRRIAT